MKAYLHKLSTEWSAAWAESKFRNQFALTILGFIAVGLFNLHFLKIWQTRAGMQVNDLVLNMLPPIDFSIPIFAVEYTALLLAFFYVIQTPRLLVRGLQMFALSFIARTITIYLIPLEPPRDIILLNDPIATFCFQTETVYVTKDLFFSGHVSAMFLFFLLIENKVLRLYIFAATIAIATMILWQHVHYTMDVLCAPLVSYVCYKFVNWWHLQTKYGLELESA